MAINNIHRKSTKKYKFTFTNSDGSAKDITGWKVYFTLKKSIDDVDGDAFILVNTTAGDDAGDDELNGIMWLILTVGDTDIEEDQYHYEFTRVIPGATPDVKPLDVDVVKILKSVLDNAV